MFYPLFVRPAMQEDAPALEKIFVEADIFLSDNGITEWPEGYPAPGEFSALAGSGLLFSVTDHRDVPLGCFCLESSDGALLIKNAVLDRAHRGQGCFATVLRYAERQAGAELLDAVAAETGEGNFIARQALVREKYRLECERTLPDGRRVVRYIKKLR
ncbi:MAG: hypothetical protein IKX86_06615 [Clostridia bacterium]|nr:hypothetical protein [Clostridia bacterium]